MDELERGRAEYARRRWLDAWTLLMHAGRADPLGAADLELLGTSAYMLGRDDEHVSCLERAHHGHLEASAVLPAARCAFWAGINLALRGEMGPASGWFGRAQRLIENDGSDCVELGYLLVPVMVRQLATGDEEAALATAAQAVEFGERFGDPDLLALSVYHQGHALIRLGRLEEGLGLLSEAMVAVVAGELSPIVTGLIYCSVLEGCQEARALRHAREWTDALTHWCEAQPDMVAFTGKCLVHRAEIMQLHGSWANALEEARRARDRFAQAMNHRAAAEAYYQEGEVLRLQGNFAAAEEAYRNSSRNGWEPQPGLGLLRLAQGSSDAATAAIRRALSETREPLRRIGLLPAYVEVMLAVDDVDEARRACRELDEITRGNESGMLGGMAAHANGSVALADGDAQAALVALRHAEQLWHDLEVPYDAARSRVLGGLACRALGDDDTAALELDAARAVFRQLGAAPDVIRVDSLSRRATASDAHGLTPRELEVLRLVAAGKSNREISALLVISEHTVARHLQNIFTKLGVSSRTAAGAFAFAHGLT
jgi:DNA-binding CsgD family transcriptional regulator